MVDGQILVFHILSQIFLLLLLKEEGEEGRRTAAAEERREKKEEEEEEREQQQKKEERKLFLLQLVKLCISKYFCCGDNNRQHACANYLIIQRSECHSCFNDGTLQMQMATKQNNDGYFIQWYTHHQTCYGRS